LQAKLYVPIERALAVEPSEAVVQRLGAVDAQADVESVLLEELAPRLIEQNAV
jgi:hypothetical protein